jgi:hypothetical protein
MPEDKDMPPITRVKMPDGTVFYPQHEKNTAGEWVMKDADFWRPYVALQNSKKQPDKGKD